MNIAQLKKNRGRNLKELQEKLEKQNQGGGNFQKDERVWKPKFNKDKGKGMCIVRFLTPKNGDPFVEVMSNSFRSKNGNFWELALQTLGVEDPVQQAAISCYKRAKGCDDKAETERWKAEGKKYLPGSKYYANVLVIKDEEVPENEGKVMIYEFGRQIYLFLQKKLKPEFDDQEPMSPFDYWEGADFKVRMVGREIPDNRNPGKKVLVPNYEESEFSAPSELFGGDEDKLNEIFDKTYDLSEFIDPAKFKSFDDIAKRFQDVTGKPYNWLSDEGMDQHSKKTEEDLKESANKEFGSSEEKKKEKDEDEDLPFEPDEKDDDADDILAQFQRVANESA